MSDGYSFDMDEKQSDEISILAARVFTPRTPISTRDLFAGRWEKLTQLADAVSQPGLHVIIYGERGVGKTSLANIIQPLLLAFDDMRQQASSDSVRPVIKVNAVDGDTFATLWTRAFDEIWWEKDRPQFGFRAISGKETIQLREALSLPDELTTDHVRRTLSLLPGSVFIFDEYDRMPKTSANMNTDLVKTLSDFAVETTIVLVGVANTIDSLVENHASISRSLIQIQLPRMRPHELEEIIQKGEDALGMRFDDDAKGHIVRMSQGLPHYTHLVSQFSVREACKRLSTTVTTEHVQRAFQTAAEQSLQTVRERFSKAVHSAHKDSLYGDVLLACAIAAANTTDEAGYFQAADVEKPLRMILSGRKVQISTYNRHLGEFCEPKRGCVLQRSGPPRGYRYRFSDPLVPPYVIMTGINRGTLPDKTWLMVD
jgi:Cdc6-like AAA superfamily ATPase